MGRIESVSIPTNSLGALNLHDGDRVEGEARGQTVELHVTRRGQGPSGKMTGERFVAKWRGRFAGVADEEDPRLASLLLKHMK